MKEGNKMDLYLPVYYKLENEVIKLSDHIYMNDQHLQVYSMTIADLIVRISTEIESLSKKIYIDLGQAKRNKKKSKILEPYFDGDCISYMNTEFMICDKSIKINHSQIDISANEISPLKYANSRDKNEENRCEWKDAYQNLKHNRYKHIETATIKNLIYSLGSLYILNIYNNRDQKEVLKSSVFEPTIKDVCYDEFIEYFNDDIYTKQNLKKIMYIYKYTNREKNEYFRLKKFQNEECSKLIDEIRNKYPNYKIEAPITAIYEKYGERTSGRLQNIIYDWMRDAKKEYKCYMNKNVYERTDD